VCKTQSFESDTTPQDSDSNNSSDTEESSDRQTFRSLGTQSTVQTSVDSNDEELVHSQIVRLDSGDEAEMVISRPCAPPRSKSPILGCIPRTKSPFSRPTSPFSRPTSPIKFGCIGDTQRANFEEDVDALMILKGTAMRVYVNQSSESQNEESWREGVQRYHYGAEPEPGVTTIESRVFTD
jgi:hypothetical protein